MNTNYDYYRSWFKPLGLYLGIKNSRRQKVATNEVLELEFSKMSQTSQAQSSSVPLAELSSQLGMTERQIEIWLKRRKMFGILETFFFLSDLILFNNSGKPSTMDKFCETAWRCLYYSLVTVYGCWCLWEQPWLWNIRECW